MRSLALLGLLLVASGTGFASGELEAPLLLVVVEDQRGSQCATPVHGFCSFDYSTDAAPGDAYVDLFQGFQYVGVATNFSGAEHSLGPLWLLPDQGVSVHGSDLYLRYPVLRIATETYQEVPRVTKVVWVELTPVGYGVTYLSPEIENPLGPPQEQEFMISYEEEGVGYEQTGPFHRQMGNTTDNWLEPTPQLVCTSSPAADCEEALAEGMRAAQETLPNVNIGAEIQEIQVATSPEAIWARSQHDAHTLLSGSRVSVRPEAEGEGRLHPTQAATEAPWEILRRAAPEPRTEAHIQKPSKPFQPQGVPTEDGPALPGPFPLLVQALAVSILLALAAAVLYSRFNNRDDLLQSSTRQRLLDLVAAQPGISLSAAAERLGIARNAVQHHVRMLQRVNLVKVHAQGQRKELYLAAAIPETQPAWLRRNPICRKIVDALSAAPEGLPRKALHQLLPDVPERTRNYHLRRLMGAGVLVQEDSEDRRIRLAGGLGNA